MIKKFLKFILFLLPWFIGSILFPFNESFYNSLNLPTFTPPNIIFSIVWLIIYILIALSVTMIYSKYYYKNIDSYNKALISNYIFNQMFALFFFKFQNLFLSFFVCVFIVITSLFLYYETKELDKKASKLLIPYVYWNLFALILITTIYFMNL